MVGYQGAVHLLPQVQAAKGRETRQAPHSRVLVARWLRKQEVQTVHLLKRRLRCGLMFEHKSTERVGVRL